MNPLPDYPAHVDHRPEITPAEDLNRRVQDVLANVLDAHQRDLKTYESLRNLNEVVGTEYGDRVLYELVQNAHDAHREGDKGRIAVRLVLRSASEGTLYVANGGSGFREEDVEAVMNIATTAKHVGEGIGNKGLGFRSIEALTDRVRIFSRRGRGESGRFDGYCFRFATEEEIEDLLHRDGLDPDEARDAARTVPRYLVPQPLGEPPEDVAAFARRGYATVIVAPLGSEKVVELAKSQVQALADSDVPLLLFLNRISEFRIEVRSLDGSDDRRLTKSEKSLGDVPSLPGCRMMEVALSKDRHFLVIQRELAKAKVLEAVEESVKSAPRLQPWRDWRGQPTVSVAVGLSPGAVTKGRLYNFLPMGEAANSPLLAHLDAPLFTDIDRRNADLELPLNRTLMEAAAEACAQAALHLAAQPRLPVPQRAVFDLIA